MSRLFRKKTKTQESIDISSPHDGSFRRGVHIEEIDGSGELVVSTSAAGYRKI